MRSVKARPLLSYVFTARERKQKTRRFPFLYRHAAKLNPLSLSLFVGFLLCLGGLASLLSLAAGLGLYFALIITYFQTRSSARNLYIYRKLSTQKCFENNQVEVELTIQNTAFGNSQSFTVEDHFAAAENGFVEFSFSEGLPGKSQLKKKYRKFCDGGCGLKTIGPLQIKVSDWFGLFHFEVIEDSLEILEVLPKIATLPTISLKGSLHASNYGAYEVAQRGHSVKFRGIREFVAGDSLKHIAWKISAKNNQIMVKEFDRMVNSQVYVAVNDCPNVHMGSQKLSTWETARDVGLALVSQQCELGNSVHYLSHTWSYDLADSQATFESLARSLAGQNLEDQPFEAFTKSIAEKQFLSFYRQILSSSTLFYITPYVDSLEEPLVQFMKSLQMNQVKTVAIFIDIDSFIKIYSKKLDFKKNLFFPPTLQLFRTAHRLQIDGTEVVILQAKDDMAECFLHLKEGETG